MSKDYISNNPAETKKIAIEFASILAKGDVVFLYGDLGFGKTTFAQGLAEGLGIKKRIISPTFVIVRTYELKTHHSKLYHVDLYRISSVSELKGLGLEEILNDKESIVVIEWPEKIQEKLPKNTISVYFEYLDENKRKIIIKNEK